MDCMTQCQGFELSDEASRGRVLSRQGETVHSGLSFAQCVLYITKWGEKSIGICVRFRAFHRPSVIM
jgi:hypothetical protein